MALRFIDLCNKVLRRMNEVEIQEGNFANTRGVQSLVKDAVRNSINQINQMHFEWPFNAAEETAELTAGISEYAYPPNLKIVDKNSFQIIPDDNFNDTTRRLVYVERDQWYNSIRARDNDAENGIGIPRFVFNAHGFGFGVSPTPDKSYIIRFRYYLNNETLVNSSDTTRLPEPFEYVIVDGAVYHMYMFKDNPESASISLSVFQQGVGALRTIYVNDFNFVYDRRVNFGGGTRRTINS
jgi:hypothetical protein